MNNSGEIVDSKALADAVYARRLGQSQRTPEMALREAAAEVGLSAATLSRVERQSLPDLPTYIKLCRWLGVPLEHFVKTP